MFQKLVCTVMMAVCFIFGGLQADAAGITTYGGLTSPEYWTSQNKSGDQLIMNPQQVKAFNAKIRSISRTVPDLVNYPATMNGDSLKTKIMNYTILDDDLYLHGSKVSENYKNLLRKQTNVAAIPATVNARYAVIVRRTAVRNLPTAEGLYYYPADKDFDALQETMLDPGEPVVVLHQSSNKYFYYVQSVNYSGWVSTYNMAFTDKNTWLTYANPAKFLVVTAASMSLKTAGEQVLYQQGAKIKLDSVHGGFYTVTLPVRQKDGSLLQVKLNVPKTDAVHEGYLPYTSNNIIRSAFKFYSMPYGWGGLKNSVDCSSLMFNAYRTVGIILPRNADEQEMSAGTKYLMNGAIAGNNAAIIKTLHPGAGMYMDGHVVMYIGQLNNVPYCIHSLGSYYAGGQPQRAMKVVVSDLSLTRANGQSFLNSLTSAVEFR